MWNKTTITRRSVAEKILTAIGGVDRVKDMLRMAKQNEAFAAIKLDEKKLGLSPEEIKNLAKLELLVPIKGKFDTDLAEFTLPESKEKLLSFSIVQRSETPRISVAAVARELGIIFFSVDTSSSGMSRI